MLKALGFSQGYIQPRYKHGKVYLTNKTTEIYDVGWSLVKVIGNIHKLTL